MQAVEELRCMRKKFVETPYPKFLQNGVTDQR